MNYLQPLTLAFGLIANVLGIYLAETPPFTHIAAGAVIVATVIGIVQAVQANREAAFIRETLSHLARSVPPSDWWREKVNSLVQQVGRSQGYLLDRIVYDSCMRLLETVFIHLREVCSRGPSQLAPVGARRHRTP